MNSYQLIKKYIYEHEILVHKKVFKRDEIIKPSGSKNTNIYFIISGSVRAYFLNNNEERILYFGFKDSIITALDSFISNSISDIELRAIKKTEVFYLTKNEFDLFLNSNVAFSELWNKVLNDIILYQLEREKLLLINSPEERYFKALKQQPELFQHIPHKFIACYLRMSPETLSRLKKS